MHDWRQECAARFAHELKPIREKIALLSVGNHHHTFKDGRNDTQEICRLLNVQYGGYAGYLRLSIHTPNRGAHITLNILYGHGEKVGGGSTKGGDLNAMVKKSEGFEFDAIILAHNHKKFGTTETLLTVPKRGEMELVEKPIVYIRAGCFMRGYIKGCISYAEKGLLNPTSIGHVRWNILPKKRHDGSLRYESKTTH